ncbi:FAD-dependent oxidoreductase [Streptomyces scopuliridis]|uniref:FAD-dependent oxidoreductase n=1 Tax=Streptomyces scopuliridis TaxID=452529 RepID=UPI0036C1BAA6
MRRILIVGGGIIGMLHAWEARKRGFDVIHLESDLEPRSATVRNLGMIWVTGRATGPEIELVLRARSMWEEITQEAPGVGFRATGALTVLYTDAEVETVRQAIERDAGVHGYQLLDPVDARNINPILQGDFAKALYCPKDAVIEPQAVLPALRDVLAGDHYQWHPGVTAVEFGSAWVRGQDGTVYTGDQVIFCVGSSQVGASARLLAGMPLQRVRLQMLQTEPLDFRVSTLLSDSLSLHYYPVYDVPARERMPARPELVSKFGIKLMVAQRADGSLTIGDTHLYDEPFDFASTEQCYEFILDRFTKLTGRPAPAVRRRWSGTYAQRTDGELFLRREIEENVLLATGIGGRGMGTAPAVAEDTFNLICGTPELRSA